MGTLCKILPNLQLEPLYNQWYVCLPMLAPVPSAMVLTYSHIPIMESYIESPEDHLILSRDLAMVGGPFVNYSTNRSEEVKTLLDNILKYKKYLIDFVEKTKIFVNYIAEKADGYSLEPEYENIPKQLKGYIELTYDMSNRPSIRFIEPLLYKSKYYCRDSQSVCCSLINNDERPFALSTPRLIDEHQVQINLPFDSPAYDDLCRMREDPANFRDIVEQLNIPESKIPLFKSFIEFTNESKKREPYLEGNTRIRYFGHACLLIEWNGVSILTDPFISYEYPTDKPRFTFSDLPPSIDYVIITHGHLDHIVLETLLQVRYKIKNIIVPRNSGTIYADPSLKLLLKYLGFLSVIEMDELEDLEIHPDAKISSLPFLGEHHDLNIRAKTAYLLTIKGKKIYIGADSSNLEPKLYDLLHDIYGPIDIVFLGMECDGAPLSWFYGPLMPKKLDYNKDQSRQGSGSDCKKAISLIDSLRPKAAYVYAMGMEPWFRYVLGLNYEKHSKQLTESNRFIEGCKSRKIQSERLFCKKEIII
jgi:L-ascorbate metabolism protein UlaG (beta-lactamase superfamily)